MAISVKIFLPDGEIIRGKIAFTTKGPTLLDSDDCDIYTNGKSIYYSITDSAINKSAIISEKDRIAFDSSSFIRNIVTDTAGQQDYYPSSTKKWIMFLSQKGFPARISLQEINGDEKSLLSCVDMETGKILRLHAIKSFETNVLMMETDWDYYKRIFVNQDDEELSLKKLMEAPAPDWPDIRSLTKGVEFQFLKRYETIGETLSQLIPASFPDDVKLELIVFLAWTLRVKVPKEDPLDFLTAINKRFKSGPLLRSLVFGHVQCLIQGISPPQYVQTLALAEQGSLSRGVNPTTEDAEQDPWSTAWYRLTELFPDRNSRIIELTHELNLNQEIHTDIPISRRDAANSAEDWLDRFSLIRSNFLMRGYIQDSKLGLEKVVYIGGAHRWPHKHLQYTARLGNPGQKPPYIQVILMPKTALDRIIRTRQNMLHVDWTASRLNFNLYNVSSNSWKYNTTHFIKSFNTHRTQKQLLKEFELSSTSDVFPLEEQDAKLLDLLSWGIYPQVFENSGYDDLLGMDNQTTHDKIGLYLKEKLVRLQYLPNTYGLVSICLEIRGPVKNLNSIARASLIHLPSATVMLSTSEQVCIIMARVPENDVYSILAELPAKVQDDGISVKTYRVSAYAGYLYNLYQRLRMPDGTWDDDVSGLLNQITN